MPDETEKTPKPPTDTNEGRTSAEEIESAPKRKKRSTEERLAWLEDENDSLKERNKTLEQQFNDLCKSLQSTPGKSGGKSLWDELSDFFNW